MIFAQDIVEIRETREPGFVCRGREGGGMLRRARPDSTRPLVDFHEFYLHRGLNVWRLRD